MNLFKILPGLSSLFMLFALLGCGSGSDNTNTGIASIELTDAPLVDEDNVTGVFISVVEVQYHGNGGWHSLSDFNTSINPINLLQLQEGKTLSLGEVVLPSGKYTQIRLLLDAEEEHKAPKSNTGCFIQFDGDRNETLYVPSGSNTGYKAIGNFDVPVNGTVNLTADFDVRKSITVSGGGSIYKLKPTIRLIVDNQAGAIKGTVSNLDSANTYVLYAYNADGSLDVPLEVSNDFSNAVTSTNVHGDGSYHLAFLNEGTYDLLLIEYDTNRAYAGHNIQVDVSVNSEETNSYDFSL